MEPIIEIRHISKRYKLGSIGVKTLRDELQVLWQRASGKARAGYEKNERDAKEFWALDDVSFNVRAGETVGLVGRNGAGKSTLLKVLSRITEPTSGEAELRGRVSSLLEVGSGFHPELSGRENIYLNGAILGMQRKEIQRKFDEIVAFSEVAKFLDTPVKRYSSGMYVRLAFAVAAHLEPEILIVDEVLAVGDASFQQKCVNKMSDVASEGRTVIFVSHRTTSVQNLCSRVVWLDGGKVRMDGDCGPVLDEYLTALQGSGEGATLVRSPTEPVSIEKIQIRGAEGNPTLSIPTGGELVIDLHYQALQPIRQPYLYLIVSSQHGAIFTANMALRDQRPEVLEGRGVITCRFPAVALMPRQSYVLSLGGLKRDGHTPLFPKTEVARFQVTGDTGDLGFDAEPAERVMLHAPSVLLPHEWSFHPTAPAVPAEPAEVSAR